MLRLSILLSVLIAQTILPSGWRLSAPQGAAVRTGTMPQGLAVSPDGKLLAVVESGVNPPALRLLSLPSLRTYAVVGLPGAFGAPVWDGNSYVLVAGANAGAVLTVDVRAKTYAKTLAETKGQWPAAVARNSNDPWQLATANDGDGSVFTQGTSIAVGGHPSAVVFSHDGKQLYVAIRQTNAVDVIDSASHKILATIAVGRHPAALALGNAATLYVAESDDDSIGVIDTRLRRRIASIDVGLHARGARGPGASPNALFVRGNDLFVSLGAENAVAIVRGRRVVERIPAGWYPTGVAVGHDGTLYVCNGYGERAPANPQFSPWVKDSPGYVGSITVGSVRAIPQHAYAGASRETATVVANAAQQWTVPAQTIVRAGGPIKHVIYIIKENRTYDQVLGDLSGGNGDASLTAFGARITPNQHALAKRFGIFDNAYTDAQVSAPGHNWTDAAFSNDFVERRWPPNYGGRMDVYDFLTGAAPDSPHNGYLWDSARRAGITFRDYGEALDTPPSGPKIAINTFPGLAGHFDPAYLGWDLSTGDLDRYAEWQREFDTFARTDSLPQLEIVYLPNDHTAGTRPGSLTPQAYVALNDQAVGKLVEHVSHSKYWRSTVILILEDDAQNGPDHVSDQRSTFYIASAYARGGAQHAHYSTTSFVHTLELFLGLPPLSIYDATARPLYDAFALTPQNAAPFRLVAPQTDVTAKNTSHAYRARESARLDFSRPDAADARILNDILEHAK